MRKVPKHKCRRHSSDQRSVNHTGWTWIRRPCEALPPQQTDELVEIVAAIVVNLVGKHGKVSANREGKQAGSQAHEPDEATNEPA